MRTLTIALAVAALAALGGTASWHAKAAAPAASVPIAGPYTHIHPAACNGMTGDHGCGPGFHWACGPYGHNCACVPC